ncbi:MAG TPA: hypothetical protein VG478_10380 [Acidimicrobiales bacterium]|jgi:hypothetical protein|nr:hypothetical protein [Acidimicrobiales bacterium]
MKHPFSGALYEQDGSGNVRVTLDGKVGLFRSDGTWIEGEIFEADPQLCGWVAGPKVAHHRIQRSQA